jgi:lipoprotein-anchoring transpeptidase ErfK/SrfK
MTRNQIMFGAIVAMVAFTSSARADEEYAATYFRNDAAMRVAALNAAVDPERNYPSTTKTIVADPTGREPGVITIDTKSRRLYLSLGGGEALQYSVGVGRAGFEWSGEAHVGRKAVWPDWTPPAAMLERQPDLPRHMAGGIDNPLGARAMYLYSGDRDLMYRIHGTNEAWSIGEAVSSGCIRMLNADVEDLYNHVMVGTKVVVL